MTDDLGTLYQRPAELLQRLIRFDTTNPPGNETELIAFVRQLLTDAGIPTQILAKDPNRPNLIARLPGNGDSSPLLLQGHVDVVTTQGQEWRYPPFEARIVDGYVWGRGALDMKGGVAMMLSAFLRAKAENASLPGDVLLVLLSDEEAGSDM
jgi:acetylornithine deacetylase/succinyl-diaminopimelate desuccinylase-like protein